MRVAVLSDIHSNVYALEAVMESIQKHGVDLCVNLGDIFYGPIAPRQVYNLLMEHDCITIKGNQDRQIYEATEDEITLNPTMEFVVNDLGSDPIEWMCSLPSTSQLGKDIFLCHGSPGNDLCYLLENIESGTPRLRLDREIRDLLDDQSSTVILCGHTHIPRTVSLFNGQVIVNPGSVGLPAYTDDIPVYHSMENYSPHASYAVVEISHNTVNVQHVKVVYDHRRAAVAASNNGREDWAYYLRTGRAPSV